MLLFPVLRRKKTKLICLVIPNSSPYAIQARLMPESTTSLSNWRALLLGAADYG